LPFAISHLPSAICHLLLPISTLAPLGNKSSHGEAGMHTAMPPQAFGVGFVIKTDGREA
jgi:hypothetical protein